MTLTWDEMILGATVGVRRRVYALSKGLPQHHGCEASPRWDLDIEGACGELALAKYLGVYWRSTVGRLDLPDVGRFQVRTSRRDNASLLLRPKDEDEQIFVLVTGYSPTYILRGWILAKNGKLEQYLRDPKTRGPAFFVPQGALVSMDQLKVRTEP